MKKISGKVLCILLSIAWMASVLSAFVVCAETHTPEKPFEAYVNGTGVRMRSGPDTSYDIVCTMSDGEPVTVKSETASGSWIWCEVTRLNGTVGYIRSDLLTWEGETNRESVTVFSAPGDWNERLITLPLQTIVRVTSAAEDTDGDLWYFVAVDYQNTVYNGYIYSPQLSKHEEDMDFETYLKTQGFPESYKPYLRHLHKLYPEWVFLAETMPVSWNEALNIETVMGRNLYGGSYAAWRTMEKGAYNWGTGRYVSFDSGNWYAAHPDVVAYYLDPRNFLTETGIYQFIGMSFQESVHTVEVLQTILDGTFMAGEFPEEEYETWAEAIFAAAKESGMSPYALASMILQEQGKNGIGASISGTVGGYEGYYNFLNVGAYADGVHSAVENGLIYAGKNGTYDRPWDSRYKAIKGGAAFYVKGYIDAGQDTLYLKKFDLKTAPYGTHQFMTNIQAANDEAVGTQKGYTQIADAALVFQIPVFPGMPDAPAERPVTTGNNNFYLADLHVDGAAFNEEFDLYDEQYSLTVPGLTETITVCATPADVQARVDGDGPHALQIGENRLSVVVTATSGRTKTYCITVTRLSMPDYRQPAVDLSALTLSGGMICLPNAYTDCETVLASLKLQNATARIETADGIEKMGYAATDNQLVIYDVWEREYLRYTLAVRGDLNGDGKISLLDLSLMQRFRLGLTNLSKAGEWAADLDGNHLIETADITAMQDHLIRKQSLIAK